MKICIIIPLFNEKAYVFKLLREVKKSKMSIVVVDDGSLDFTKNLSTEAKLTLLIHPINLGKGAAMKTGAEYAFNNKYDAAIFMDADGQHSAKSLNSFKAKLESGNYDVVFGSRNLKKGMPAVRYLGNRIASIVIKVLFGVYISDPLCGYRAITKTGYKKIKWESAGYGVELEMLARTAKAGLNFAEVAVETIYHDRHKGVSILDAFGVLLDVIKWRITP
jgi:glycosyltransferase involved in cell wall biosynthesis